MAQDAIFICYRREDSIAYAGRLYDRLAAHFGKDHVFMDVDTVEPGEDFVEVIRRKIADCRVLIAVIGKSWVAATDDGGVRRLDNPDDYVRLEITAALKGEIRVIPALVGGAAIPRSIDLPEGMKSLVRRNTIEISDVAFHQGVARLIETLEPHKRDSGRKPTWYYERQIDQALTHTDPTHDRMMGWWRTHQLVVIAMYFIASGLAWQIKEWLAGMTTAIFFAVGIVATVAGVFRGHLLFTERVNTSRLTAERQRAVAVLLVADLILAVAVATDGVLLSAARPLASVLTIALGVSIALARLIVEPSTTSASCT